MDILVTFRVSRSWTTRNGQW